MSKATRIIFIILMAIAGMGVILSVGSLLNFSHPWVVLGASFGSGGLIGLGYFLGTRDPRYFIEVPAEDQEKEE